jgi:hypothetical protein
VLQKSAWQEKGTRGNREIGCASADLDVARTTKINRPAVQLDQLASTWAIGVCELQAKRLHDVKMGNARHQRSVFVAASASVSRDCGRIRAGGLAIGDRWRFMSSVAKAVVIEGWRRKAAVGNEDVDRSNDRSGVDAIMDWRGHLRDQDAGNAADVPMGDGNESAGDWHRREGFRRVTRPEVG